MLSSLISATGSFLDADSFLTRELNCPLLVEGNLCRSLHLSVGGQVPLSPQNEPRIDELSCFDSQFSAGQWQSWDWNLPVPGRKPTLLSSLLQVFVFSPDHIRSRTPQEERNLCDHKGHPLPLHGPLQMLKSLLCHLPKHLQGQGPPSLPRHPETIFDTSFMRILFFWSSPGERGPRCFL